MSRRKKSDDSNIIHLFLAPFYLLSILIGFIINFFNIIFSCFKPKEKPYKLNNSIGITTANCPYCGIELSKFPARKTKCKNCGKYMYVRTRPADNQRIIIKEEEISIIQDEWDKKNNVYELKQKEKTRFELKKAYLMQVRKTNYVSDNDVYWNLYQEDRAIALSNKEYMLYADITDSMGDILFEEKKYKAALQYYCEMVYISICCNHLETGFMDKNNAINYHLKDVYNVRKLVNCGCECDYELEDIKEVFMNFITIQEKFPLTREEAWNIFESDYNYFLNEVID